MGTFAIIWIALVVVASVYIMARYPEYRNWDGWRLMFDTKIRTLFGDKPPERPHTPTKLN